MSSNRRLAAIMFTDIVGYTAMMQENETMALQAVATHEKLLNQYVFAHGGEIQNLMGDGSLCIFPSATNAVKCARDIQLALREESSVPLRIGIHVGEVITDGTKAYGDGVNIASRIEESGHAGVILISESVRSKLINQPELTFESVGKFNFKNVTAPMEIFALKGEGLATIETSKLKNKVSVNRRPVWLYSTLAVVALVLLFAMFVKPGWLLNSTILFPAVDKDLISVAVFPFKTSGHVDIEYLGEGMMDLLHSKFISLEGMTSLDPIICKSLFDRNNGDVRKLMELPDLIENDVDYAVSGSVIQLGTVVKFIGNLMDKKGESLEPIEVESHSIDQLYYSMEVFSIETIYRIQQQTNTDFTSIAVSTSNNFNALKEYMHGEKARRQGDFSNAHNHYMNTVEIDSTYTLGWLRLWNNLSFYFNVKNRGSLISKCKTKLNLYKNDLPSQLILHIDARNMATEGNIQGAVNLLKKSLHLDGDNIDNLYLLGELIYHCGILINMFPDESKEYFQRIMQYTEIYFEAEGHLSDIALRNGDFEYVRNFLEKYKHIDNELTQSVISHYIAGQINENYKDSLLSYTDNSDYFPADYLMIFNKYNIGLELFNKNRNEFRGILKDNFKHTDYKFLQSEGKFLKSFNDYPEKLGHEYFGRTYWLSEPNFQPISQQMADSVLQFLETYQRFNLNHGFHFTARSLYRLIANKFDMVEEDINSLQKRVDTTSHESSKSIHQYNLYRLKISLSRKRGNNKLVLRQIDSLYQNMVHFDEYSQLILSFYFGLKFLEAEVLLEEGSIKESLDIFERMDNTFSYSINELHAPIKFRLAYIYDLQGEKQKAYKLFKYFVSIYGDCDEFYQHNVRYARDKIAEYEAAIR